MNAGSKSVGVPDIRISMTAKRGDSSVLGINNHFSLKNNAVAMELIRTFQNNSLKPALLERLDSIKLS